MKDTIHDELNRSSLQFMTHKLFMHYKDKNTKVDPNNPHWINQGVFFWDLDEKFEKKSLPPEFQTYIQLPFFVKEVPETIKINMTKAIPWFGMEGHGNKYNFSYNNSLVAISHLFESGYIQYFKQVKLTSKNLDLLQKRDLYIFHFDDSKITFDKGQLFRKNTPISLADAYKKKYLRILQLGPDQD